MKCHKRRKYCIIQGYRLKIMTGKYVERVLCRKCSYLIKKKYFSRHPEQRWLREIKKKLKLMGYKAVRIKNKYV